MNPWALSMTYVLVGLVTTIIQVCSDGLAHRALGYYPGVWLLWPAHWVRRARSWTRAWRDDSLYDAYGNKINPN